MRLMWPVEEDWAGDSPEKLVVFEAEGGGPLVVASNFPYEVWLDGRFAGDGGHRCVAGEAFADRWDDAASAKHIRVRLHWMDPERTDVLFRCLFDDPFFADLDPEREWTCSADDSVVFGDRMSAQLPRQNLFAGVHPSRPLRLGPAPATRSWSIVPLPVERARYVEVDCRPIPAERPGCDTYDLGRIALHRFEVDAEPGSFTLHYGEVARFEEIASTPSRAKVRLSDAVAAPFGTRGCRYLHVLYDPDRERPSIRAWRREYPLRWRPVAIPSGFEEIVDALRANLVACVDGGLVDTCWRERAQWTGDLRMSAMAVRALTENREVVDLALRQIARSYDEATGMVQGVWPIGRPDAKLPIPPFHLAFCLAAIEHDPRLESDPALRHAVLDSVRVWRERYLRRGLVAGMPGWYFVDWDPTTPATAGRNAERVGPRDVADLSASPHAVCNAWWAEVCRHVSPDDAPEPDAFDRAFWAGAGYALTEGGAEPNPHATAAALSSGASRAHEAEARGYLERSVDGRVTPYYAYFVARSFEHGAGLDFVRAFYGPIAREYGTIYEKTTAEASLAHGWSVGVAALIVG